MNRSPFSAGPVLLMVCALLLVTLPAGAHHVSHEVTRGEAVVVSLAYGNGSPLAHDRYEIIAEGEEAPYQSGNTDAAGRIVFLPDRDTVWRIRVFSEDGHGADFTLEASPAAAEPADEPAAPAGSDTPAETPVQLPAEKTFVERFAGPVAGVGIIFGLFGIFSLFTQRRR